MEKLFFSNTRQITRTSILCAASLCAPVLCSYLQAQEGSTSSVIQKELNRRISNTKEAQELLIVGDQAYKAENYKESVDAYQKAFNLLPKGAATQELRNETAERYATAAVEYSRRLNRFGKYEESRTLLDAVLNPNVAPAHLGAIKMLEKLDDPIRYNPSLTDEHVDDIVKVARSLRIAQGYHQIGDYDKALASYTKVLQIDRFNTAARRGMEQVNQAQSDYARSARDHTRAEMLQQVDSQWELSPNATLPANTITPEFIDSTQDAPILKEKLSGIILENVQLNDVNIEEAVDYVKLQSRLADTINLAGEQDGVNIILNLGNIDESIADKIRNTPINIQANNLPLAVLLDYITDQSGTQWKTDGISVIVTASGSADNTLTRRTYTVPPNFLTHSSSDSSDGIFDQDDDGGSEGKLAKKVTAKDLLKQNGVQFPEGASASYFPSNSSLTVFNTSNNLDIVDQYVSAISKDSPTMIVTKATIIRISEEDLKELSFDWLLSPAGFGSSVVGLTGGSIGSGIGISESDNAPLTTGLRSGDSARPIDALDTFLNSENSGFATTQQRAPSVFKLTGVFSGAQIELIMRGLNQSTGTDIMTQQSVISRNGERATIESVRELIYPTEYEPPEIADTGTDDDDDDDIIIINPGPPITAVTPSHPTAFETRKVGVTLEVEAASDANKQYIDLSIKPELVEFEGFVNYGSPINGNTLDIPSGTVNEITPNDILLPIFNTITTQNTNITIQDGATIVIGGLLQSNKTKVEDKVPILGDIPFAGRLFRSDSDFTSNEAVIIMVNCEIVDPSGKKPWKNQ